MILDILYVIIGTALLYIGGECLIRGAVSLSAKFGISQLIIGLTVVALGTSLPELFVSVVAAINNNPEIATANIMGSSIINIALILPLVPLAASLYVPLRMRKIDYPIMLFSFLCVAALLIEWRALPTQIRVGISMIDGVLLLGILIIYFTYIIRYTQKRKRHKHSLVSKRGHLPIMLTVGIFLVGIVALSFGSDLLVSGAVGIAQALGVSTRIIALTVVAHGTNFPEMFTVIAALRKGKHDIIIGNLVGSNIINILLIFGVIGVAAPISIHSASALLFDMIMLIAISIYTYIILVSAKGSRLRRTDGILILVSYIGYFSWILSKG